MKKTKKPLAALLLILLLFMGLPIDESSASGARYSVKYDGNGADSGSVIDTDSPYYIGDTVTVKSNGFVKEGYTFTGWEAQEVRNTITGYVAPVVYEDLGNGWLEMFEIIVELRLLNGIDFTEEADYQTIVEVSDSATGKFTFTDVADGEYILFIYRPGYLLRIMRVMIDQNTSSLQPSDSNVFELMAGDFNSDGVADVSDMMTVVNLFGTGFGDANYSVNADFNADGVINADDMSILMGNLNNSVMDYTDADDFVVDFLQNNFKLVKNSVVPDYSIDGNLYAEGGEFNMPAANVVLYAQWEKTPAETTPVATPKTADISNIGLWVAVLCITLFGIVCLLWRKTANHAKKLHSAR